MLSTLTLTSLVLIAISLIRQKGIRLYVASVIISAVTLAWAYSHYGLGEQYTKIYVAVRIQEIAAMLWLARPRYFVWAFLLLIFYAPLSLYTTINFAEGALFLICGVGLIMRSRERVMNILAILWLMMACFDFGYAMDWRLVNWATLNLWWPTSMYIAAFLWIALDKPIEPARLDCAR